MQINEHPDIDAFRHKVTALKDMNLYADSRVQALLKKMLNAVK